MNQIKVIQQKIRLQNGEYMVKKYSLNNFLGKGGFAKCYQATQLQSQQQYAIKIINKETLIKSRAKQKLLSEIKIHKALSHKYIVKFISVFQDQSHVYIVLELCTSRSLSEMVKKRKNLTVQQTRYFILQLLSALEYLHDNKVIHRDLKMANIFLNQQMDIKLGDFGLSAKLQFAEQRKRTMAGTPNYIAPQIIQGTGGHSYQVDIWSTGVICYALLFGRPPFQTSELKMTYNRIKNCQYNFPNSVSVPNSAKDFIKRTLVVDPKKRMTISEMYSHPFLRGQRPKIIPRSAVDTVPVFSKQDLITQQANTLSSTLSSKSPKSIFNVITNSSQINKTQSIRSSSQNQKLPRTERAGTQRPEKAETKQKYKQRQKQQKKQGDIAGRFDNVDRKVVSGKYLGVMVVSYVDYSTKYGLGYFLSNGVMGVYFNDSTIMAVDSTKQTYFYLSNPAHNDQVITYTANTLPSDHNFNKKKTLMHKFQAHLKQQTKNQQKDIDIKQQNSQVFIKQWLKTKHAIMFRLSNKIFQVDFFDNSQILLRTDTKQIKFKNKKGEQSYMTLSEALHQKQRQTQLGRRIKYTKQILNSLKKDQVDSNSKQ